MKKLLKLSEVREMFNRPCHEVQDAFEIKYYGENDPDITFVVSKEFQVNADGSIINPLDWIRDQKVIETMNMNFNGDVMFMFGNFWHSEKTGIARFRPKNPKHATDLLIRVIWGTRYNGRRGTYGCEAQKIKGVKYFYRSTSRDSGVGNDYWVVPVGFYRDSSVVRRIEKTEKEYAAEFKERSKAYRKKYAKLYKEAEGEENS